MIAAGKLNKRVTIQTQSTAQNAYGEVSGTWTDLATVWASVAPISGKEVAVAKAIAVSVSHVVTIRHRSTVDEDKRLKFGTRTFSINYVHVPNEDKQDMMLYCTESK